MIRSQFLKSSLDQVLKHKSVVSQLSLRGHFFQLPGYVNEKMKLSIFSLLIQIIITKQSEKAFEFCPSYSRLRSRVCVCDPKNGSLLSCSVEPMPNSYNPDIERNNYLDLFALKTTQFSPKFEIICPTINGFQPKRVSVELNSLKLKTLTPIYRAFDELLSCEPTVFVMIDLNSVNGGDIEAIGNFNFFNLVEELHFSNIFVKSNSSYMNVKAFNSVRVVHYDKIQDISLVFDNPYRYDGPEDGLYELSISDVNIAGDNFNYLIGHGDGDFIWGIDHFYPKVFQSKNFTNRFFRVKFLSGPKYLHKETLLNLRRISRIHLGSSFLRIEYGTLLNGRVVRAFNIQDYFFSFRDVSSFTTGKCEEIPNFDACVVCFMHQYGFHRLKDKVAALCLSNSSTSKPMKKCYWTSRQSLTHVGGFPVFQPDEDGIEVCESFPEDLREHLNANYSKNYFNYWVKPTTNAVTATIKSSEPQANSERDFLPSFWNRLLELECKGFNVISNTKWLMFSLFISSKLASI